MTYRGLRRPPLLPLKPFLIWIVDLLHRLAIGHRMNLAGRWGWIEFWLPWWYVGVAFRCAYHWPRRYQDAPGWAPGHGNLEILLAPFLALTVVLERDPAGKEPTPLQLVDEDASAADGGWDPPI